MSEKTLTPADVQKAVDRLGFVLGFLRKFMAEYDVNGHTKTMEEDFKIVVSALRPDLSPSLLPGPRAMIPVAGGRVHFECPACAGNCRLATPEEVGQWVGEHGEIQEARRLRREWDRDSIGAAPAGHVFYLLHNGKEWDHGHVSAETAKKCLLEGDYWKTAYGPYERPPVPGTEVVS